MEGSRLNSYHPIKLEIYRNLFSSIAQEMGTVLRRTAYSPNIKERRDYSCALFDDQGQLVAMGAHMPVHLGSMPPAVQAVLDAFPLDPGDVVVLSDPLDGGTHLPDVTMVRDGHSSSTTTQDAFLVFRRYLQAMRDRVLERMVAGKSLAEIRKEVTMDDFKDYNQSPKVVITQVETMFDYLWRYSDTQVTRASR